MPILSARVDFNKHTTPEQRQAREKAARAALCRIYCDVMALWRSCANKHCKRHRRCCGEAAPCLERGRVGVPRALRSKIIAAVRAGGPARVAPINNVELKLRREPPRWL